jgi:hypothetical protein
MMSFARTIQDPILRLLILGAIGVALFASLILKASDDIVFGVLFIGCLNGVPRNQDAQRSGLGNELVSVGTGLHSSTRHFQRTRATRRRRH